jgi:hypothetical protein
MMGFLALGSSGTTILDPREEKSWTTMTKVTPRIYEFVTHITSQKLMSHRPSEHWVGFEVFTATSMKMAVFWVLAPRSLVEVYQRFRGSCCLHHQGDDDPDDGGSKYLWNVGKLLPDYMALQPRRRPCSEHCCGGAHNFLISYFISFFLFLFFSSVPSSILHMLCSRSNLILLHL